MSGLVGFFRGFVTGKPEDPNLAESTSSEDNNVNNKHAYRQSLSSAVLFSPLKGEHARKEFPTDEEKQAQKGEDSEEGASHSDKAGEGTLMELVPYAVWRAGRNHVLQAFMAKRLQSPSSDDDSVSKDSDMDSDDVCEEMESDKDGIDETDCGKGNCEEEFLEPDNDDQNVPFWEGSEHPESQPALVPLPTTPAKDGNTPDQTLTRKRKIPHAVNDTTHMCTSIHTLDLYAKECSLDLCRIEKIWPLRRTSRQKWMDDDGGSTAFPMDPYKSFEDDGPIGALYKLVLSVEVTRLESSQTKMLYRTAQAAFSQNNYSVRRLRIFFFGKYAEHVSSILSSSGGINLMSLQKVPAKCILPFTGSSSTFYDRDTLADYCVCIGDSSGMVMDHERVRFDEPSSFVVVAAVGGKKQTSAKEIFLREDILDQDVVPSAAPSILEKAYHEWQDIEVKIAAQDTSAFDSVPILPLAATLVQQSAPEYCIDAHSTVAKVADTLQPTFSARTNDIPIASEGTRIDDGSHQSASVASVQQGPSVSQQQPTGLADNSSNAAREVADSCNLSASQNIHERDEDRYPYCDPLSKRQKIDIHYHKLSELRNAYETSKGDCPVNINGVVLGFGSHHQTRSSDWMMIVRIMDETLQLPSSTNTAFTSGTSSVNESTSSRTTTECTPVVDRSVEVDRSVDSISVMIFVKYRSQLPQIRKAGDVFRAHRVYLQEWNGEIQVQGRRKSQFVVGRPKSTEIVPLPCREEDWHIDQRTGQFDSEDLVQVAELWHWGQSRLLNHRTIKLSQRFKLSDMRQQGANMQKQGENASEQQDDDKIIAHGDLTVMIAAVIPVPNELRTGITPRGFLRVWDGTGPPISDPLPIDTSDAHDSVVNGDPPVEALVSIASVVHALSSVARAVNDSSAQSNQPSDAFMLEAPECLYGRVVNVAVWEGPHWDLVSLVVRIGTFIRLRNVEDKTMGSGFRCIMVHNKSSMTPLPDKTFEIRTLLQEHQIRVRQKDPFNRRSGLLPLENGVQSALGLTEVNGEAISSGISSRLRRHTLAKCISEPAGKIFAVEFHVVKTEPSLSESEVGLRSLCVRNENGSSKKSMVFQFVVRIDDRTAQLDVLVADGVAECLLGRTADEACQSTCSGIEILDTVTMQDATWNGTIRSVVSKGFKYFTLESVSPFPVHQHFW